MRFIEYNPDNKKGYCVVRAISKALNKDIEYIENDLKELASKLNIDDYRDEEVFDKYLKINKFTSSTEDKGLLVKDALFYGTNIVYGYIDDWYHLVCISDNVIYDKSDKAKDLEIIKVYKKYE